MTRTNIRLDHIVGPWFLLSDDERVLEWSADMPGLLGREKLPRRFPLTDLLERPDDRKALTQALRAAELEAAVPPQEVAMGPPGDLRRFSCGCTPLRGRGPRLLCQLYPSRLEEQDRRRAREAKLTARQQEILRLIVDGCSTEEMASRLGLRPHTVRNHVRALLARLGVRSKLDAVVLAFRRGLI